MKRSLCITLLLCVAVGCGKGGDEPVDKADAPKPVATVASQSKVTVVETKGELAKVRTADGKEVYVPKERLQERSTLDRSAEEYTHVLSAATAAYETAVELPKPQPRPTKDVATEQLNVNQLYLSERTMTEVIAPARFMAPWDEQLGERCFPAMTCENPDCPGEAGEERPYLFIIRYSPGGAGGEKMCPACSEEFDSANWTDEERVQYRNWVKPYRLPEQAARLEQLNAELKASARSRRSSPAPRCLARCCGGLIAGIRSRPHSSILSPCTWAGGTREACGSHIASFDVSPSIQAPSSDDRTSRLPPGHLPPAANPTACQFSV